MNTDRDAACVVLDDSVTTCPSWLADAAAFMSRISGPGLGGLYGGTHSVECDIRSYVSVEPGDCELVKDEWWWEPEA